MSGRVTEPSEEQLDALLNHWSAPKRGDVSHDYRQGYLAARDYALNTLRLGPSADFPSGGDEQEQAEDEEGAGTPDLVSAIDVRRAIEETTAELERLRNPRTTWQLVLWDRLFPSGPTATGQQEALADPKTDPIPAPAINVTERVEAVARLREEAARCRAEAEPLADLPIPQCNLAIPLERRASSMIEAADFLGEAGNEGAGVTVSREDLARTLNVAWMAPVPGNDTAADEAAVARCRAALDTGGDDE